MLQLHAYGRVVTPCHPQTGAPEDGWRGVLGKGVPAPPACPYP